MLRFVAKIAASFFVSIDLSVNSLLAYGILRKLMINKPSAKDFATKQCIFWVHEYTPRFRVEID